MTKIQETIGYQIAQVCHAHRNAAHAVLSDAGVHVGQEMLLMQLWEDEGLTQSELADQLCVEAPTITRMLQRMEKSGLIERQSDPDDARVSRVYVTEEGASLQPEVEAAWHTLEEQTLENFTTEERLLLRRLLLQIQDNLSK